MKSFISIIKRNKGISSVILAVAFAVFAILVGAYVDLKLTPGAPLPGSPFSVSTSTDESFNGSKVRYYENSDYGYSLNYPRLLEVGSGQNLATSDLDGISEASAFTASFPEVYTKGTNLSAATLIVGAKSVSSKVCQSEIYGNKVVVGSELVAPNRFPPTTISIGDIEYSVVSVTESGVGSTYTTTRYSTMHDSLCYTVSIVAKSFNDIKGHNESNPGSLVIAYNQDALDKVLDEVIQTFAFTN